MALQGRPRACLSGGFAVTLLRFSALSGPSGHCRLPRIALLSSKRDLLVMRIVLERSNLLKSLNHVHRVVERRNTIPILSNVLLNATGASLEMKATDLDLEVTEATAAKVERAGATTVPAHLLYDIVRKLPEGAEVMLKTDEDGNSMSVISGRSSFRLQCLPQSDFPELTAGSFSHIFRLESAALKRPHRQDAVRDLDRGDALLSQRHLPAHARGGRQAEAALGGDRRAPAGARRDGRAGGLRRHARHHHSPQDGERAAEARRRSRRRGRNRAFRHQDPLHDRQRGADLQADRRNFPRLPARHPDRQRQEARHRPAELRAGGRPRVDDLVGTRPRREAVHRRRAGDARRQQSGFGQRHRGACGRLFVRPDRDRLQRADICSTLPRSSPAARRGSCWPTPARRR